jgi:hypothetical protein
MADAPVLTRLSAALARRLGDPKTRPGAAILAFEDGVTYSGQLRIDFLREALTRILNTLSYQYIERAGFVDHYCRWLPITTNPFPIPSGYTRVLAVRLDEHRKLLRQVTEKEKGRLSNLVWMNVPMWAIEPMGVPIDPAPEEGDPYEYGDYLRLWNVPTTVVENVETLPADLQALFVKQVPEYVIPTEQVETVEDLVISTHFEPYLLDLAEVIGRRVHQENSAFVQQRKAESNHELNQLKES